MTPKEKFIASAHRSKFAEMAKSEAFDAALDYALLQLEWSMPTTLADPSKSWDYGASVIGARRVLEILRTLAEPEKEPKTIKPPSLNYNTAR